MPTLVEIAPTFSFILARGWTATTVDYRPEEFGNAVIIASGEPFSLKFERDRSQLFVEIGNEASGWFKLEYVVEFLDSSINQQMLGKPPETPILASLLEKHFEQVVKLFRDPDKVRELRIFCVEKSRILLGSIFRRP